MKIVYFVQSGSDGAIKIGTTANLKNRLGTLQGASPRPLEVLATFPGDFDHERALHTKFAAHSISGEWFHPAPELLQYVLECIEAEELLDVEGIPISAGWNAEEVMYCETMRDYLFLACKPEPFEARAVWVKRAGAVLNLPAPRAMGYYHRKIERALASELFNAQDILGIARRGMPSEGGAIINAEGNETDHLEFDFSDDPDIKRLTATRDALILADQLLHLVPALCKRLAKYEDPETGRGAGGRHG